MTRRPNGHPDIIGERLERAGLACMRYCFENDRAAKRKRDGIIAEITSNYGPMGRLPRSPIEWLRRRIDWGDTWNADARRSSELLDAMNRNFDAATEYYGMADVSDWRRWR